MSSSTFISPSHDFDICRTCFYASKALLCCCLTNVCVNIERRFVNTRLTKASRKSHSWFRILRFRFFSPFRDAIICRRQSPFTNDADRVSRIAIKRPLEARMIKYLCNYVTWLLARRKTSIKSDGTRNCVSKTIVETKIAISNYVQLTIRTFRVKVRTCCLFTL